MNVLFFLRTLNLDRLYEPLLAELARRGHRVTVVVERDRDLAPGAGDAIARLGAEGAVAVERLPSLADPWRDLRRDLRASIDYLRYLEPRYAGATALRRRARGRAPAAVTALDRSVLRSRAARGALERRLRGWEAAVPVSDEVRRFVSAQNPDVMLVAPLVTIGSSQSDWVEAAAALGVPSVLPVASWDNLTNKGTIKRPPSAVLVWNAAQAEEATTLHGLPPSSVHVVGAHSFDPWFARLPREDRAAFARRVGLPDDRPFLLYLASSRFIAADESAFVREWVERIRASEEPLLREASVLIRPHPLNPAPWEGIAALDDGVVVWPPNGEMPTGDERRAGFFDSIFHASAVIGVNTTAMIEAAIVGRPSFTLLDDRFRETQEGTLHFSHIAGGLVVTARTWPEHLAALGDALRAPDAHRDRLERFVASFVRPRGVDVAAASFAADAIEHTAAMPSEPVAARPVPASLRGLRTAGRVRHRLRRRG